MLKVFVVLFFVGCNPKGEESTIPIRDSQNLSNIEPQIIFSGTDPYTPSTAAEYFRLI